MKKMITAALTVLCLTFAAISAVSADEITYVRGDADGDGVININDVTAIQRYAAELEELDEVTKLACDVDQSKKVTLSDATIVQRFLAEYGNTNNIGVKFSYDPYELPFVPSF